MSDDAKNRLLALKALGEVRGLSLHEYMTIHESIMNDTETLTSDLSLTHQSFWGHLARLRRAVGPDVPEYMLMTQNAALIAVHGRGMFWRFEEDFVNSRQQVVRGMYHLALMDEDDYDGSWELDSINIDVPKDQRSESALWRIEAQHRGPMALTYLGKSRDR